ncbi:hypothetical protein N7497_003711 [Penicillium chrysogenum]|nr:hypothetical protein N7497_003711 [Penicillium chrysogenum]
MKQKNACNHSRGSKEFAKLRSHMVFTSLMVMTITINMTPNGEVEDQTSKKLPISDQTRLDDLKE